MPPIQKINVKQVIDHFGGVSKLTLLLNEHGHRIRKGGVEKWRERSSIPAAYLISLSVIAEKEDEDFKITRFLKK
tara:strand:+ start:843 stop:1067 length:225 start_codon:yes stop_codon:yes gene_type:complete